MIKSPRANKLKRIISFIFKIISRALDRWWYKFINTKQIKIKYQIYEIEVKPLANIITIEQQVTDEY